MVIMGLDVYYLYMSPPCRAVILTGEALGIKLNLIPTDILKKENMTEKYLEMNIQHTVPTLNDNGFCLAESRAIMQYLCDAYGHDDSLYPKDLKKRALVNQRMYFDCSLLYQSFANIKFPIFYNEVTEITEVKRIKLANAIEYLDKFLKDSPWVAGQTMTIADIAILATISSIEAIGYDFGPYENVLLWLDKCKKTVPGYNNTEHLEALRDYGVLLRQSFSAVGVSF